MLSTVLFIDDTPVGYQVNKKEDKLLFIPTQFSAKTFNKPQLSLSCVDGMWLMDSDVEGSLKIQVFQDVERFKAAGLLE